MAVKDQLEPPGSEAERSRPKTGAEAGINLGSIPRKEKQISTPGLRGMAYLEELALCQALEKEDAHFVDYVLKPATDEMWNLIKEERNIQEIIAHAMLEFDLKIKPESWLPVFAGWQKAGLITIQAAVQEQRRKHEDPIVV